MIECPVFCYRHDVANATNDTGVAFMLTASQEKKKKKDLPKYYHLSLKIFFFFFQKKKESADLNKLNMHIIDG
jgi:hypothetical protein